MIVDIHTHFMDTSYAPELVSKGYLELGSDRAVLKVKGISSVIYLEAGDIPGQIRAMDEAGLDMKVLSSPMVVNTVSSLLNESSLKVARELNDKIASIVGEYPDRLLGMASINPFDAEHLDELKRAVTELGLRGVCVDTSWDGEFLDSPKTRDFFKLVNNMGIPVFLHPPHLPLGYEKMKAYRLEEIVGRPFDTTMSVARMIYSGLFDKFQKLKIILAHMGGAVLMLPGRMDFGYRLGYEGLPKDEEAKCKKLPSEYVKNFYVDTMGFWAPGIKLAIEVLGADHVLLGTDYPNVLINPREHIEIVKSLKLSEEDEERILWKNAEKLFRI